jgi:hypothetical protein
MGFLTGYIKTGGARNRYPLKRLWVTVSSVSKVGGETGNQLKINLDNPRGIKYYGGCF